ncbi:hypothetical protein PENTCL1PPCAC_6004, partial [Pristionchus entomophagus]
IYFHSSGSAPLREGKGQANLGSSLDVFLVRESQTSQKMASSSKTPVANTPSPTAIRRLSRDLQKLKEEPIDGIDAQPLEENILEWHYVIKGSKGTAFEGGLYHGKLVFPCEFPWKPPSIYMFTPNGRFLPNQRLCLSISDYHPETWNPGWTVSAILVGLHSFMNESSIATGTESTSAERKKELAVKSASYNLRDATFCKLFPALVNEIKGKGVERMTDAQAQEEAASRTTGRYAGFRGGVDVDFLQNARQHMQAMQNEMDAAMRAAVRREIPPAFNPILPDDLFFGAGAGRPEMVVQQPQLHVGVAAAQDGAAAAAAGAGWREAGQERARALDNMIQDLVAVERARGERAREALARQGQAGPAVAALQAQQQQIFELADRNMQQFQQEMLPAEAAAAGPQHPRRAGEDPAGLDPPPPKRIPDVVTLD